MKPLRNNWHDPRNVWNIATDSQGKISKASGVYYHNDIMTSFSLLRQPEGRRSAYRGHIEIISQISGNVLVRKYEKDGKYIEKKVRAELNCKDCSEREMKAYIASSAERLYRNYQNEIAADYQSAYNAPVTPNTITPRRAFDKYAPAFLHAKYPRSTDRKKKERLNQLNKFYSGLENIPMCKYSASQLKAYIQSAGIGKETAKLAGDFWNYCLDRLYVSGTNPFPAFADTRISPKALQSKALRANTLSTETFYNLFDLLAVKASGMDCGVALLASGFTAEQICDLRWKNLYFDPSREDFVTVGLFLAERAGAQHNYTRPCIPMTALLLRTLHSELEKKSPKSLKDKYVVTTGSKKTTPGELNKYAAAKLVKAGVGSDTIQKVKNESPSEHYARILLHNTYRKLLVTKCGLSSQTQGGTIKFLCGLSLAGDVTSSNYTSFTSPESTERLYTILKILQPERPIEEIPPASNEDGSIIYHITPNTTAETAGVVSSIMIPPGWRLEVSCPHGVSGTTRTQSAPSS